MILLKTITDNFLAKFDARFSPQSDKDGYLFYADEQSKGIFCSNKQYYEYVAEFEFMLKKYRRIIWFWIALWIPCAVAIIFAMNKFNIPETYAKTAAITLLMLPLVFLLIKGVAAYKIPNELYESADVAPHPRRSRTQIMDSRLQGMSYPMVWLLLSFNTICISLSIPLKDIPEISGYLWFYVAGFVVGVYVLIRKLRISTQHGVLKNKRLTFSETTKAVNPGRITLIPSIWARHRPLIVVALTLGLLLSFVLTMVSLFCFPVLLVLASINVVYWIGKYEHFASAASNPGQIISVNPPLIAVSTDLARMGQRTYPVIKIIKYKATQRVNLGDRIGTIANYSIPKDELSEYWKDVHPIPINYATEDSTEIDTALASYTKQQWDELQKHIQQINKPYKPGLYKIKAESSAW